MRICVISSRFTLSGVPLAQIRFARALACAGHEVELIIGHVGEGYTVPEIEEIKVHIWRKPRAVSMLPSLIKYFISKQPEVVFSAEDHTNAIVLLAATLCGSRAKISCSSRVTPFDTHTEYFGAYSDVVFTKRWALKQAMRLVMPRADALTCVSEGMAEQYRELFKNSRHVCVYNIIVDTKSSKRMNEDVYEAWLKDKEVPVIIGAGTLARRKGFKELILAFAQVAKTRKARLLILGEGPSRPLLEGVIKDHNLTESVKLLGLVDNPLKYFSRADVFVLSSFAEGMPNALVEAMMCGCTPVATNCPTGPKELLRDGKYGYLVAVGDSSAIAGGIEKALDRPIGKELLAEAVRPFEEHAVISRHFALLGLTQRSVAAPDDGCAALAKVK
jgi:glycosyltransferase involved in cell wall biosynthesis